MIVEGKLERCKSNDLGKFISFEGAKRRGQKQIRHEGPSATLVADQKRRSLAAGDVEGQARELAARHVEGQARFHLLDGGERGNDGSEAEHDKGARHVESCLRARAREKEREAERGGGDV